MPHIYSVGGIHPTEGSLAYAACECFATRDDAEAWRAAHRKLYGPHWSTTDILTGHARIMPDLPLVSEMIARMQTLAGTVKQC